MAIIKPPKVRLAAPGSPNPEVFNLYQVISLISSLYIKVSDREDIEAYKSAWTAACDSILLALGDAYDIWQIAQNSAANSIPVPDDLKLINRTSRLALRLVFLEEQLTIWYPISKWLRMLGLVERKLGRLAMEVANHNPYVAEKIKSIIQTSVSRSQMMSTLEESARKEDQQITDSFALPVLL